MENKEQKRFNECPDFETVHIRVSDGNAVLMKATVELLYKAGYLSTSLVQRKLIVGYGRAVKAIELMRDNGIVTMYRDEERNRIFYLPAVGYDKAAEWLDTL